MTQIKVTVTVEYVESPKEWTISENVPNCATGGNPLFLAADLERGLAEVSERLVDQFVHRFGDIREIEARSVRL